MGNVCSHYTGNITLEFNYSKVFKREEATLYFKKVKDVIVGRCDR